MTAYILTAYTLDGELVGEPRRRFTKLPIRIGRNPVNDFPIQHPVVSSAHARIDEVDGRLCIIDLGSKNGVHLPTAGAPRPIAPNEPVDLAPSGNQFFLAAHLRIQIEIDQASDALDHRGGASAVGDVLGNRNVLESIPPAPSPFAPASPPYTPASPYVAASPPFAPTPTAPPPVVPAAPMAPMAPLQQGGFNHAAVPVQHLEGAAPALETRAFQMTVDQMALQGLRELAASLVPGVALDTSGDVARFITKLHDALEVFCRSFIPLRDGYQQFVSSLDLQRGGMRTAVRSAAYRAVEAAQKPEDVAVALMNPKDRSFDAPNAVEGILADLMLHQVALLEGVMSGVRALLDELAPENVEQHVGSHLPLGRHKALWQAYCRIHEDLSEERQTFARIFGPDFTAAYRQYRTQKPEGGGRRG